jgi:hypothetical protein
MSITNLSMIHRFYVEKQDLKWLMTRAHPAKFSSGGGAPNGSIIIQRKGRETEMHIAFVWKITS